MNLDEIRRIASENMEGRKSHPEREPGYIFYHGLRTANLTGVIMSRLNGDLNAFDPVLYTGALFHDVGKGFAMHNETGADLARNLLSDVCSPEELERISRIVRFHCVRKNGLDLEAAILAVQDADMIDHYGTQGIWLDLLESAHNRDSQLELIKLWDSDEHRGHIAKMRGLLNFDFSKMLFDDRISYQRRFLERLKLEAEGKIPDEMKLPASGKR